MPERSSLLQAIQLGVETTPGTSVAANKLLQSVGIEPAVQVDMSRFRPMGSKFATIEVTGKEWVEADISGVGTYSELIYLFSSCMNATTPVQQGATTAYLWHFQPAARAEDTVKTFTVEQGGSVRAHKFSYGVVSELEIELTRDGIDVSGSMLGQRITDGITLTGSPTSVEEKPIIPTEIDVFVDDTFGGLGSTKLLRVLSATWRLGDRFNPVWVLNSAQNSFVATVETEPTAELVLMLEADAAGMAPLTQMRAGSTKFIRVAATSPDLAGAGFPYKMTLDQTCKVKDVGDFSDEDGVYAIEWTFDMVYEPTWSRALSVDVYNKQTAL